MKVPSMVVIKPSSSSWVFSPKYHVGISILGEPIERIFRQFAVQSDRIVDFDARHLDFLVLCVTANSSCSKPSAV
jgi:hypothetical protein